MPSSRWVSSGRLVRRPARREGRLPRRRPPHQMSRSWPGTMPAHRATSRSCRPRTSRCPPVPRWRTERPTTQPDHFSSIDDERPVAAADWRTTSLNLAAFQSGMSAANKIDAESDTPEAAEASTDEHDEHLPTAETDEVEVDDEVPFVPVGDTARPPPTPHGETITRTPTAPGETIHQDAEHAPGETIHQDADTRHPARRFTRTPTRTGETIHQDADTAPVRRFTRTPSTPPARPFTRNTRSTRSTRAASGGASITPRRAPPRTITRSRPIRRPKRRACPSPRTTSPTSPP